MACAGRDRDGAITIEVLGVRITLRTQLGDLVPALLARLPPPESPPIPGGGYERQYTVEAVDPSNGALVIHRGRREPVRAWGIEAAADLIARDLQLSIAQRAEGLIFVHAGVIAWQTRALVLPGRSGSGKSRLVDALVRAGARYLSDEFAIFAADGLVHPYARPIGLRRADGRHEWKPQAVVASDGARPARPKLIAFLRYGEGSRWRPRPLSAGQTFLGLLRHTVAARRRLALARSLLVPVAVATPAIRAPRGEASEIAERLLEMLGSG